MLRLFCGFILLWHSLTGLTQCSYIKQSVYLASHWSAVSGMFNLLLAAGCTGPASFALDLGCTGKAHFALTVHCTGP